MREGKARKKPGPPMEGGRADAGGGYFVKVKYFQAP